MSDNPGLGPEKNPYVEYLMLRELFACQRPRSVAHGEAVHDETLFIIMHQTMELWFFQIIQELEHSRTAIRENRLADASNGLTRIFRIFSLITLSWDVLSTLHPREFWKFRKHFLKDRASGLQSENFRIVEFLLGVGARPKSYNPDRLEEREKSIWDEVNLFLKNKRDVDLPKELCTERNWSAPYPYIWEDKEGDIHGDAVVEAEWFRVYSRPADHRELYHFGERLLDVSAAVGFWRAKHVGTVQRFIGDLRGSGDTAGAKHLKRTLAKRVFPELWSVRNRFDKWLEGSPEPSAQQPTKG